MIVLPRAYPSIFGAPAIRAVDRRVFSLGYFMRCMDCGYCGDQCCDYGVDIDRANMERLAGLGPAFEAFAGVPQSEWFEPGLVEDAEFPSGAHGRTRAAGGKCVFARRGGRGCAIHAYCLEQGLDYHLYKPMVSALFPVTFEHGVLVPSPEAVDGTLRCGGIGPSLYDGVRSELAYYFGRELVEVLDGLRSAAPAESRPAAAARARR